MDPLVLPSPTLSLSTWFLSHMDDLVVAVFVFAFGACVGSFLNVVAHRMPTGRSVVSPPSRCPRCGWRLTWHENLPVLGWLLLRGRCRRCRGRISVQYPLVELLVGVMFAGSYLLFFAAPDTGWISEIGGRWWRLGGFGGAWPAFTVLMTMVAALVIATMIDAKTFLIPAAITNVMILVALPAWLVQGFLPVRPAVELLEIEGRGPLPQVGWQALAVVAGAGIGNLVAITLLQARVIPRSFADYDDFVTDDAPLAEYPHGRREMGKELLFLLPILLGAGIGWAFAGTDPSPPPRWLEFLGSSLLGFLVGGGVVWLVRILGTLAFGREAMGMGDVHLLAGVGAALGWADPLRVFFLAPFLALAWIAATRLLSRVGGRGLGELPYGPHLAVTTLLVVYARPLVEQLEAALFTPPG